MEIHSQALLWIAAYFVIILWAVMQWNKKLPSMQAVQELASVLNSRGGNIMVLGSFSVLFFISSIKFAYWITSKQIDGKVSVELALATATFSWLTGSAFGGAFTSMVKAMTGENTKARASDGNGNGNGDSHASVPTPVVPQVQVPSPFPPPPPAV